MSSDSLYRPEALAAKRVEWLGPILVAAPLSRWLWASLATAFATALILFLTLGHYTRREAVSGQLVPGAGLLNLAAASAGLVTRVWVHDGQGVNQHLVATRASFFAVISAIKGLYLAGPTGATNFVGIKKWKRISSP